MNNLNTVQLMRSLKLTGMADCFEAIQDLPIHQKPTMDVMIAQIIDAEYLYRQHRKTKNAIYHAKFRYQASLNDLICNDLRNLTRETIAQLSDCAFIDRGENIIITGATGCGKSFLASALGHQACIKGKKVAYFSLPKLFSKMKNDRLDGSFTKEIDRLEHKNLLILDDWGLAPLDGQSRLALLQIIEDRHQKYSTIITSQLPINAWHQYINDNTIADAILDRIIHQAIRIDLKGDSLRKIKK